jgi:aminoglycoside phosphotransferase
VIVSKRVWPAVADGGTVDSCVTIKHARHRTAEPPNDSLMTPGGAGVIGPKLGEGREAEVFAWGDDAVVKLYRPGYRGHRAETTVLSQLDGRAGAPRLIDVVDHDGRRGLVLERLPGSDMLTSLQRRPWRLMALAEQLAEAHLVAHDVLGSEDLPDLRQILTSRIQDAPLPPQSRDFALRILDGLPAGDRLCHGDYHPGNVLVAGDRVGVIDWANAARGVPEADHARTLLLLRFADPLPATPLISRGLMAVGRSQFARAYVRAYRRDSPQPQQHVGSWLTVNAAARMSDGIEVEWPKLLGLLDHARREAK